MVTFAFTAKCEANFNLKIRGKSQQSEIVSLQKECGLLFSEVYIFQSKQMLIYSKEGRS